MTTLELEIEGMTCEHCAQAVRSALQSIDGVEAEVSWKNGRAAVRSAGAVDPGRLVAAVRARGYRARPVDAQAQKKRAQQSGALHVVILGSGSAAFAAAIAAAERGARITMVEAGTIGGTCVNVGCVPSKILIRAAEIAHLQAHHPFDGIGRCTPAVDRRALHAQQQALVDKLRQSKYRDILAQYENIEFIAGKGSFEDARRLRVELADGTERMLTADRILIATGARPHIPGIPGLAQTPYWTSTDALSATEAPEHLLVLGGSAVALELAQAFRRLGSAVTVLARSVLLSREDPEVGAAIEEAFRQEGITVQTRTLPQRVEHRNGRFELTLDGEVIRGDRLLVATGRNPNTSDLRLERAGVDTDARGAVIIDSHMRTSADPIYAAGDCTDLPQFVYVAAAAGSRAAMNMLGEDIELDLRTMPAVVFTDPQVATVGMSGKRAQETGWSVETRTLNLDQVPRALANFETRGFIKLIADRYTGTLLGAQIVAPQAGEIVQTAALAMRARMTVDDLAGQLFAYLTMAEGIKLCAQIFRRDVAKLSCCAG